MSTYWLSMVLQRNEETGSGLVRVLLGKREREREREEEIVKEVDLCDYMTMEAEKSHDISTAN